MLCSFKNWVKDVAGCMKVLWHGRINSAESQSLPVLLACCLFLVLGIIGLVVSGIKLDHYGVISAGSFLLLLLLCVGVMGIVCGILPLFTIRRFQKKFGFLPPVTKKGVAALQYITDYYLSVEATFFFRCCQAQEAVKKLFEKIKHQELTIDDVSTLGDAVSCLDARGIKRRRCEALMAGLKNPNTSNKVYAFEELLRLLAREIGKQKKVFWKMHALVQDSSLPVPFKVARVIKAYKDIVYGQVVLHDLSEEKIPKG